MEPFYFISNHFILKKKKLQNIEPVATVTSVQPNETRIDIEDTNKQITIVDFPGHPRLRSSLDEYIEKAGFIFFLVPAHETDKVIREISQYLCDLLTNPIINNKNIPFAIVCTRLNQTRDYYSNDEIKKMLEKEMYVIIIIKYGLY